jgi:hypothetical protein
LVLAKTGSTSRWRRRSRLVPSSMLKTSRMKP